MGCGCWAESVGAMLVKAIAMVRSLWNRLSKFNWPYEDVAKTYVTELFGAIKQLSPLLALVAILFALGAGLVALLSITGKLDDHTARALLGLSGFGLALYVIAVLTYANRVVRNDKKALNLKALQYLGANPLATRADVQRALRLSPEVAQTLCDDLVGADLVREAAGYLDLSPSGRQKLAKHTL